MPLTWTLRIGPVVHRESIPLSELQHLKGSRLGAGDVRHRNEDKYFVRVSDDEALFSAPSRLAPFDEAAVVTKGSVVIKGENAVIVYRASVGVTIFLTLWFGLLIAGAIGMWVSPPAEPLMPALIVVAMMAGTVLLVRSAAREQIGLLRGIALEAVRRLRDGEST